MGTLFTVKLEALEATQPADRFEEDHRIWIETTRRLADLDSQAARAVWDQDVVEFVLIKGQFAEVVTRSRLELSSAFCERTATRPSAAANCRPEGQDVDGDYRGRLNQLLREFQPQLTSMNGSLSFPLPLIRGELAQLLSAVAENIKVQLEATVSGVNSLTVPDQMSADQERLEVFFSRVSAIFGQAKHFRRPVILEQHSKKYWEWVCLFARQGKDLNPDSLKRRSQLYSGVLQGPVEGNPSRDANILGIVAPSSRR